MRFNYGVYIFKKLFYDKKIPKATTISPILSKKEKPIVDIQEIKKYKINNSSKSKRKIRKLKGSLNHDSVRIRFLEKKVLALEQRVKELEGRI